MITAAATASDFAKWEAHARTLTVPELRYVIADCRRAEAAMRGWNPSREGYYADQAFTYADELRRRQK